MTTTIINIKIITIFIVFFLFNQTIGQEPEFVYPLENITIAEGYDAHLHCVINNIGPYKVAWIRSSAVLTFHNFVTTRNQRITVTYNDSNSWTLNIKNVTINDSGQYRCQINTDPMKDQSTYLQVAESPEIIQDGTSDDNIILWEGASTKLVCNASGVPKPTIMWQRVDSQSITDRNLTLITNKVRLYEGETLFLTNVTRTDMGEYLCIASNGYPPATRKYIKLQVHFGPSIHIPNDRVGANIGSSVTLTCKVEASPKTINYWRLGNGEIIISNFRHNITEERTSTYASQMQLQIVKLQKSDFGDYKCVSRNIIGEADKTIRLYELPVSETFQLDQNYRNSDENNSSISYQSNVNGITIKVVKWHSQSSPKSKCDSVNVSKIICFIILVKCMFI